MERGKIGGQSAMNGHRVSLHPHVCVRVCVYVCDGRGVDVDKGRGKGRGRKQGKSPKSKSNSCFAVRGV